jgi:hypothetical protein
MRWLNCDFKSEQFKWFGVVCLQNYMLVGLLAKLYVGGVCLQTTCWWVCLQNYMLVGLLATLQVRGIPLPAQPARVCSSASNEPYRTIGTGRSRQLLLAVVLQIQAYHILCWFPSSFCRAQIQQGVSNKQPKTISTPPCSQQVLLIQVDSHLTHGKYSQNKWVGMLVVHTSSRKEKRESRRSFLTLLIVKNAY